MVNVLGNNKTYLGIHVKLPVFLSYLKQILIFPTDFSRNPSSGGRADKCKWTEQMDGRTDRHDEANGRFSQQLCAHTRYLLNPLICV